MQEKYGLSKVLVTVLLLATLTPVISDLYLPSLPFIAQAFQVSARDVQLSLFYYLTGLALSQLIYGPLSDAIGRKVPLMVGLSLCVVGSVICFSAQSIEFLNAGRVVQGIGAGSGIAISRSIMRDVFSGSKLAKMSSYLSIANIAVITSAPFLGGYLQEWFHWRAGFIFLTGYTLFILFLVKQALPETGHSIQKEGFKLKVFKENVKFLLRSPIFRIFTGIILLTYANVFAWLTTGPILLQTKHGLSPTDFGLLCLVIGFFYAIGSLINARLLSKYPPSKLILMGGLLMCLGGASIIIMVVLHEEVMFALFTAVLVFLFGTSFVFGNSFACVLTPFGNMAGTTVAVIGFFQVLGGVLSSGLMSVFSDYGAMPMGVFILLSSSALVGLILYALKFSGNCHD